MTDKQQTLLIVLLYSLDACVALTCLQCTDVPIPRDCGKVKRCGAHEGCYIDRYLASSGHTRYNLGCRNTSFCMSTGRRSMVDYDSTTRDTPADDVILRSSGDVKTCQSCCTWDLCNNGGCGVTGYPARQSRGPVCYTCAQQHSPESCDSITVCNNNSICKVKLNPNFATGDVFYTSMCEDSKVCHREVAYQTMILGRKRFAEEVHTASHNCVVKCCDGDKCNGNCGTGNSSTTPATTALTGSPLAAEVTTVPPATTVPPTTDNAMITGTTLMSTGSGGTTTLDPTLQVFCQDKDVITCPTNLDPLCGSDKSFYLNHCEFNKARCDNTGLTTQARRYCEPTRGR